MEISRQSWHYRLLEELDVCPSQSLCIYFWKVVGCIAALTTVTAVTVSAAISMMCWFVFACVYGFDIVSIMSQFIDSKYMLMFMATGYIGWSLVLVIVYAIVVVYAVVKAITIGAFTTDKMKMFKGNPDSLVSNFVQAKKDKVCPVLTFKD